MEWLLESCLLDSLDVQTGVCVAGFLSVTPAVGTQVSVHSVTLCLTDLRIVIVCHSRRIVRLLPLDVAGCSGCSKCNVANVDVTQHI